MIFLFVCEWYENTFDTFSVLLGGFEQSGGKARCFKCGGSRSQMEMCPVNFGDVDFELD